MIIILAAAEESQEKTNDIENDLIILSKVKQAMKNNQVVINLFRKFNKDINLIDGVPIDFSDDIDVSAKTINSRIILNRKLLSEPFNILLRYAVHEVVHSLQHLDSEASDGQTGDYNYLDDPDEVEAFQVQIEFDKNNRGEAEVVEYVEELLDYHDIPESEHKYKKDELLENI